MRGRLSADRTKLSGFRLGLRVAQISFLIHTSIQPARAEWPVVSIERLGDPQTAGVSLFAALSLIATIIALLHLTGRKRWAQRIARLMGELTTARERLDRAQLFLATEPQIFVSWGASDSEPDIEGDLSLVLDAPVARRVLGFGSWLPPESAQSLESFVTRLRERGEAFRMGLRTIGGRHIEAEGRAIGGRAVLRLRDVSGQHLEVTRLRERQMSLHTEIESFRTVLDASAHPAWRRDAGGTLIWVNAPYAASVEAASVGIAVTNKIELLDSAARAAAAEARRSGLPWRARVSAVVGQGRHPLDVVEVAIADGSSAGLATDLSEIEAVRREFSQQTESHARTLDQLQTAVAIFDSGKRLLFHNAAYRQLWTLDPAFLAHNPRDTEILDRLRSERRLPEQADFRAWKAGFLAAYQSVETTEQVWYLPDGRTLRVVINPNPQGGVTYLFDDVTERFGLESRFNASVRVQTETLDALKEGVAVFGTDGRLKLFNPAFAHLWRLDPSVLADKPHIDTIARYGAAIQGVDEDWQQLKAAVAGLPDARTGFDRRLTCSDGRIMDSAAAPLADGSTLITFTDVTARVNVERALTDRNQALLEAEKLRNDFVHHVSYELRSPLTNIIGFIQLLADGTVGTLNDKQREYTGYVRKSSAALLAIINDILDLATIDTGAMELQIGEVDIRTTIDAAAEGVQDRLAESNIRLSIVTLPDVGAFRGDAKRVRQVLFNLLSNAIGFSTPGQTVTLAALRRGSDVVFKVSDEGRGIPPEVLDSVFDRFTSHTLGSRHRGVGLGLSIVRSFVELHGGTIHIESAPGEGTTVTCIFPADVAKQQPVAGSAVA